MTSCCDSTDLIVQSGHWVCLMCGCVDAPCLDTTGTSLPFRPHSIELGGGSRYSRQKKIHQWTSGLAMRSEGDGTIVQRSVTQEAVIAEFERIRERYNLPASIPQVTWSQWNHLTLEMKAQHCYLKRNTTRMHLKTACFYFAMLQERVAVQKKLVVQMMASVGTRIPLPSLLKAILLVTKVTGWRDNAPMYTAEEWVHRLCSRFEMGFQIESQVQKIADFATRHIFPSSEGPGNPVYVACVSLTFFSHHVPNNVIVNKRSVVRATGYSDPKLMVKHKREILSLL
ncbi:hypothetical protein BJ741DRAFT_615760 [Chytriomyces cf. hyalinus JEL632]|nr:hypothetical protein BJ741DRAFT_615760 [Chytriomyces cf. hyalinus JEL632]